MENNKEKLVNYLSLIESFKNACCENLIQIKKKSYALEEFKVHDVITKDCEKIFKSREHAEVEIVTQYRRPQNIISKKTAKISRVNGLGHLLIVEWNNVEDRDEIKLFKYNALKYQQLTEEEINHQLEKSKLLSVLYRQAENYLNIKELTVATVNMLNNKIQFNKLHERIDKNLVQA